MTWGRVDAVRTGLPVRMQWPAGTDIPGPPLNMLAVAGDVVVTATTVAPGVVALRFINAKTGAQVASRALPVSGFTGIRADTADGKPIVEAVYASTADQDNLGLTSSSFKDTVFGTSGRQLWTNGGQRVSNYIGTGLLADKTGGLVTGGYTVRFNQGVDQLGHGATYTVQDLTGKALLTVPRWASVDPTDPTVGTINAIELVGGYAVVIHGGPGKTAADPPYDRFWVYDLRQGAKQVAAPSATFPMMGRYPTRDGQAVAVCGSKMVLALTYASSSGSGVRLTVLDIATGRLTPPVDVPLAQNSQVAGVWNGWSGLADASCSTMLINDRIPAQTSIAIDLSRGTLLWQKPTPNVTYNYLSIHGGVIYALQESTTTTAGQLVAINAASGATQGTGFTAVPLAYTTDGTPIFAEAPNDPAPASPPPSPSVGEYCCMPSPQLSSDLGIQLWAGRTAG